MKIVYKKIISFLLILGLLLFLLLAAFYKGYLQFNYPSQKQYPIQGIDVSSHQGTINWSEIDTTKVNFVYIKATEGGDFVDKEFHKNWTETRKRNIVRGAYHFFTFCKSGDLQAQNFIKTVPYDSLALPPVIDLEYGGNCKLKNTQQEILREIKVFEKKLNQYYGKKPILYVTQEFYEDFLIEEFPDNPLWFRDIYSKPRIKDSRDWILWQYANRAHRMGIKTYVDLNVFNGNAANFKKIMKIE